MPSSNNIWLLSLLLLAGCASLEGRGGQDHGQPSASRLRRLQHLRLPSAAAPYLHVQRYRDGRRPGKPGGYYNNMTSDATLVLPASLAASLPPCGQLSFSDPVAGAWLKDPAGHWAFEMLGERATALALARARAKSAAARAGGAFAAGTEAAAGDARAAAATGEAEVRAGVAAGGRLDNAVEEEAAAAEAAPSQGGCRLRRLAGQEAAACLAGRRVVMIGDSVTRYQYSSLAHYLASGQYQHPYDDGQSSVSNKGQWPGWGSFYKGAVRLLERVGAGRARVSCVCAHGEGSLPFEVWNVHLRNISGALQAARDAAAVAAAKAAAASAGAMRQGRVLEAQGVNGQGIGTQAGQGHTPLGWMQRLRQWLVRQFGVFTWGQMHVPRESAASASAWDGSQAGVRQAASSSRQQQGPGQRPAPEQGNPMQVQGSWHSRGVTQERDEAGEGEEEQDDGEELEGGGQEEQLQEANSRAGGIRIRNSSRQAGGLTGANQQQQQPHPHHQPKHMRVPHDQLSLDFFYAYKYPSFLVAGLEALSWAFNVVPEHPVPGRFQPPTSSASAGSSSKGGGGGAGAGAPKAPRRPPMAPIDHSDPGAYWHQPHWVPPDVLVFNMGIFWWSKAGETLEEVMAQIFSYARTLAEPHGTRLIWKTTSVPEWDVAPARMNEVVARLAREHGFEVFDARAIARAAEVQQLELKWNNGSVHFLPVAYEQFNDLILNVMCPQDGSYLIDPAGGGEDGAGGAEREAG